MKPFVVSGLVLVLAGLGCFAGGAAVIADAVSAKRAVELRLATADKRCREALATIGSVTHRGAHLDVVIDAVDDPRSALADATASVAACPHRTITAFCLGAGCGHQDDAPASRRGPVIMTFTLTGRPMP